jgi:hypothetical protein
MTILIAALVCGFLGALFFGDTLGESLLAGLFSAMLGVLIVLLSLINPLFMLGVIVAMVVIFFGAIVRSKRE